MMTSASDFLRQVQQLQQDVGQLKTHLEASLDTIARQDAARAAAMEQLIGSITRTLHTFQRGSVELSERVTALNGLVETSALLNSTLDPKQVIDGVIDTIVQITGAERAYIVLIDGNVLTPYAARNWDNQTVPEAEVSFSRSIIRASLEQGKPIVTTNAQSDERFERVESIEFKMVRAVLCVPLASRDETIGVVYADNRLTPGIFNTNTVQVAQAFANQAAIAIENARRFEKVKNDLEAAQIELKSLRIRIDEGKREEALRDITETEYFRQLQDMVQAQRSRHKKDDSDEQ
jgi:GAF domain-containing protein